MAKLTHVAVASRVAGTDLGDACVFCPDSVRESASEFDLILAETDGFRLVPALGMLVPGYFLVTAADHQLSVADTGASRLRRLEDWLALLLRSLTPVFGEYFVFEHGDCATDSGGSCISHAHLHLIPLAHVMRDRLLASVAWTDITSLRQLRRYRSRSYLYLGIEGAHFVLPRPGLGSQWVRRMIGEELGRDDWDWAVNPGRNELAYTLAHLPVLSEAKGDHP